MTSQSTSKNLREATHWPSRFEVPKFSIDVELRLKKANNSYHQTKVPLDVPRDVKSEILSKLVQAIFEVKPYPTRNEVGSVVIALVRKHPCLTEEQPSSGWDAWLTSLWFKVGNYHFKLRQAGMPEVAINRKRYGKDGVAKFSLKKSRRVEINFVPDHPEGQMNETLEEESSREVVEDQPLVREIEERWPAMFLTDEICREFERITKVNLMATFQSALEKFAPALLKLYRSKKESEFRALLVPLDEKVRESIYDTLF
ncbi:hypothetical protein ACEWY4_001403 [Coilia grayii]|uniref:Uncharacterized protein n=1 Tax=Coilia grayii TaxID=363190 RepID=A0ABD1KSU5_9TELE